MSIIPRYDFPAGTEVTLYSQKMALSSRTDEGYEFMNVETGEVKVTSFSKFVELMKSPAMRIENPRGSTTDIVSLRLGGLKVAEQLPVTQQEDGKFHHAICMGAAVIELLVDALIEAKLKGEIQLKVEDFAEQFALRTGISKEYTPFTAPDFKEAFDPQRLLELYE